MPAPFAKGGQNTASLDPKLEYPTPSYLDFIVVETVSVKQPNYVALAYGTAYPSNPPNDFSATHVLVFQQQSDNGEDILRFYAANRANQDAYNPSLSYVDESSTHPIYTRDYLIPRASYAAVAALTADPINASALLTAQQMLTEPSDARLKSLYVAVRRTYKVMPGPYVITRERVRTGVLRETKRRLVVATTVPGAGGGAISNLKIAGKSVAEAYEEVTTWTDDAGVVLGSNPIFVVEEIKDEERVIFKHYAQEVPSTDVAPVLGAAYGTSFVWVSSGITSITVVRSGSGYTTVPTVTVATPGAGVAAVLSARMKAITATVSVLGSGYSVGDAVTVAGGTFSQAAVLTVASMKIATLAVNAAGSGYLPGQTITLAGGTFTTAGVVTIATAALVGLTADGVGEGYAVGDLITLTGGTFTTAAVVEVVTLLISGLQVDDGGEDYIPGEVIVLSGGTSTTPAEVTVDTLGAHTLNVIASGFLYQIGDYITLSGGLSTIPCVVQITDVAFNSCSLLNAGTGYAIGNTITLAGGTFLTPAQITVATVGGAGEILTFTVTSSGIYSATVDTYTQGATSGIGVNAEFNLANYAIYNATITTAGSYTGIATDFIQGSTTGTGTGAQIQVTSWKAITVAITNPGNYTVVPATLTQASSSGAGIDATFNAVTSGVRTVSVNTAGSYSASGTLTQFSTDGIGFGETFSSPFFSVLTVTLTTAGSYTVTSATFTQGATSGTGAGATFNTATFSIGTVTVTTAGLYTVLPANPVSVSGIGGATFTMSWGVGSVVVTSGGSGYTSPFPVITFSSGNAIALANVDGAAWTSATAYIVNGKLSDQQDSPNKIKTWTTSPVPPVRKENIERGFEFPAMITVNDDTSWPIGFPPSPGINYTNYRSHTRATYAARATFTYQVGQWSDLPEVFSLDSPGAANAFGLPITENTVHNAFTGSITRDGTVVYTASFDASSPSYAIGDTIVIGAGQQVWRGNIWVKRIIEINENQVLY